MNRKCIFKTKGKRMLATLMTVVMTALSLQYISFSDKTVKAADNFPATGVHSGTLSHGSYHRLTNLNASTGATVTEADTMTSSGASRACFCMSPGVSETTKSGAYKSANYTSGYGIKYYKAMIAFYYDCKDSYKTDAVRYAAQFFVWRTVVLERSHKGNFAASAYDGSGFKSGFIATMKSLMGYSDTTATNLYNKAYGYIKDGANGAYNNKVALLKWTATASQTMLTGKVYSDKKCNIKITKELNISGTGISLKGTKYELRKGSENGTKAGTFTLNGNGTDTVTLKADGAYEASEKYFIREAKNVAGTVSNAKKDPVEFTLDWSKIADGKSGGTASITSDGISDKPSWFKTASGFNSDCKNQLVNDVPYIKVTVKKIETGTKQPLSGGEFTIYAYNKNTGKYDTKVSTSSNLGNTVTNPLVTGEDGTAESANLYYTAKNLGKFMIQETKAPAGYVNKKEKKLFTIKSGNGVTQETQTVTMSFDDPKNQEPTKIYLEKEDETTGDPIFDAEFTIQVYKNGTNGAYMDYSETCNLAGEKGYEDLGWYELRKAKQKTDPDGNLTNNYEVDELYPGRTYMLYESKRPTGYASKGGNWSYGYGASEIIHSLADSDKYNMNYTMVFTVQDDGSIKFINNYGFETGRMNGEDTLVVNNNKATGKITVKKKDDETFEPLSGASFEVWEVTEDEYNNADYVPSAENGDILADVGETDENGELVFENTIQAEHYYLMVEIKAPEGYRMPDNPVTKMYVGADEAQWVDSPDDIAFEKEISITNKKAQLDLNIHKVSTSRTGKESAALPGAEFALYRVEKIVTDVGALSDEQLQLDDENNNGVDDDTEDVITDTEITDASDTGAADEESTEIDYSVLSSENYIDFDYSTIEPIVSGIVTDNNGNAVVSEILEEGAYVLVETKAPKNYLKADPQYIFIDSNTLYSTYDYDIEIKDEEFEARITVEKLDSRTGKTIRWAGTGYKIKNKETGQYVVQTLDTYAEPEVEGAPHELISSEQVDTFYTDESGTVQLPEVLAVGTYELEEVAAPDGYLLADETLEFTIDDETDYYPEDDNKQYDIDENTRDVVITVEQENNPTAVEFHKTDFVTGEEIDGAELEVWYMNDSEKVIVDSWTSSSKEPHIIYGLEIGKEYHISETSPADGYATAEDVVFTVKETADVQKVEIKDQPTTVQITKSDITTGDPVIGATLQIIDKEGKVVEEWVTEKEPHLISRLPIGNYTLRETQAPTENGYVKQVDVKFTVQDTSEIQKVDMEDDYTKVQISKTNITGTKEIEGAVLRIENAEGKTIATWTTEGKSYEIDRLAPGKYTLIEESAPYGYIKSENVDFTVEETGEIQKVKMTDKEAEGTIKLVKKDKDSKKALAGVEFTVTDSNGNVIGTMTTDRNGYAEYSGLAISTDESNPYSIYYVYESKALSGYAEDDTKHKVTFKYLDQNTEVIIKDLGTVYNETTPLTPPDKPNVPSTPKTGIQTENFVFWIGMLAVVAAIFVDYMVIRAKRKKKSSEEK